MTLSIDGHMALHHIAICLWAHIVSDLNWKRVESRIGPSSLSPILLLMLRRLRGLQVSHWFGHDLKNKNFGLSKPSFSDYTAPINACRVGVVVVEHQND